jgi:hypothetical protein
MSHGKHDVWHRKRLENSLVYILQPSANRRSHATVLDWVALGSTAPTQAAILEKRFEKRFEKHLEKRCNV